MTTVVFDEHYHHSKVAHCEECGAGICACFSICEPCREEAFAKMHSRDEDCDVDPGTMLCRICCVDHSGDPCAACGGRAFHRDYCEVMRQEIPEAEAFRL